MILFEDIYTDSCVYILNTVVTNTIVFCYSFVKVREGLLPIYVTQYKYVNWDRPFFYSLDVDIRSTYNHWMTTYFSLLRSSVIFGVMWKILQVFFVLCVCVLMLHCWKIKKLQIVKIYRNIFLYIYTIYIKRLKNNTILCFKW